MKRLALAAIVSAAATPLVALSDAPPTKNDLTMAKAVAKVEEAGYGPIIDASFDDGRWEFEAVKDDAQYELALDPKTGEIVAAHEDDLDPTPPRDAKSLAAIVDGLTKSGWTDLADASYEGTLWEVEAYKAGQKYELHVDAATGEVVRERLDD